MFALTITVVFLAVLCLSKKALRQAVIKRTKKSRARWHMVSHSVQPEPAPTSNWAMHKLEAQAQLQALFRSLEAASLPPAPIKATDAYRDFPSTPTPGPPPARRRWRTGPSACKALLWADIDISTPLAVPSPDSTTCSLPSEESSPRTPSPTHSAAASRSGVPRYMRPTTSSLAKLA